MSVYRPTGNNPRPARRSRPRPQRAPGSSAAARPEVVALALDPDTLYIGSLVPDGGRDKNGRPTRTSHIDFTDPTDRNLTGDLGALLDYAATLMPGGGTIAIDGDAVDLLGWPHLPEKEEAVDLIMPERPRAYQDAARAGWRTATIDGWTTFERGTRYDKQIHGPKAENPQAPDHISIVVSCLAWMHRGFLGTSTNPMLWHEDSAMEACYLLTRAAELIGMPWGFGGGSTMCMTMRAKWIQRNGAPRPGGGRKPFLVWDREGESGYPSASDGAGSWQDENLETTNAQNRYVIAYDSIAQHLGAITGQRFGIDPPGYVESLTFDPAIPALWWLDEGPYLHESGFPLALAGSGRGWVHTEVVKVIMEHTNRLGDSFAAPAWAPWHRWDREVQKGSQVFKHLGGRISTALQSIPRETDDPLEGRLREALKSLYSEAGGSLTMHRMVNRRDWAQAIYAASRAQILRRVIKVYEQTGKLPIDINADAIAYETQGTDPEAHNPCPDVLKYDPTKTRPGFVKDDFTGTLAEWLER